MTAQDKRAEAQINERLLAAWFDWLVASGYKAWSYMYDDMIRFMAEFRERYPLDVYGTQASGTPPPPEEKA